jgi:hypothetical protein
MTIMEDSYQANPTAVQSFHRLSPANSGFITEPYRPKCHLGFARRVAEGMMLTLADVETDDSNRLAVEAIRGSK